MTIIRCALCFLLGVVVTLFATRPSKAWDEGYKDAKEFYSDWNRGFDDGWNAAFVAMKDIAEKARKNDDRT